MTKASLIRVMIVGEVRPVDSPAVSATVAEGRSERVLFPRAQEGQLEEDAGKEELLEGRLVVDACEREQGRAEFDPELSREERVFPCGCERCL